MAASSYQGSRNDHQSLMDISSRLGSVEASIQHGEKSREMMRGELRAFRDTMEKSVGRIEKTLHELQSISESVRALEKRMERVEAIGRDYQKTKNRGYGIAAALGLGAGGAAGSGFDKIVEFFRRLLGG